MAPPAMDRRTAVFFLLTSSVVLCSAVCMLGTLGIPYIKLLTVWWGPPDTASPNCLS
jgi:hypothetical protein